MEHKNTLRKLLFPGAYGLRDDKKYQVHETEVEVWVSTKPSMLSTEDSDFKRHRSVVPIAWKNK